MTFVGTHIILKQKTMILNYVKGENGGENMRKLKIHKLYPGHNRKLESQRSDT